MIQNEIVSPTFCNQGYEIILKFSQMFINSQYKPACTDTLI